MAPFMILLLLGLPLIGAKTWEDYVIAPPARQVKAVALANHSAFGIDNPSGFLTGAKTRVNSLSQTGYLNASWPSGTIASATNTKASQGKTTYSASNAIDGKNITTIWSATTDVSVSDIKLSA